jgi:SprT-like domain-contaning protein Spartan
LSLYIDILIDLDPSDPNPDLHGLFLAFNQQYFWGLLNSVEVRWSNRMTLVRISLYKFLLKTRDICTYDLFVIEKCAGLCEYRNGGYICIRMSEPLLKFRPRSDMIDTLLHEMIHAYLFVTHNIQDHCRY